MTYLIGRFHIGLMVLVGSALGLLFLLTKTVMGEDLSGFADTELSSIIKSGGQKCKGCNREELLELASKLSEGSKPGHRDRNDSAASPEDAKETTFEEIQDILDELREKIENDARERQSDTPRPSPDELDAMAKELREEFLNAFKNASPPSSGNSDKEVRLEKEEIPLDQLSSDDARFRAHKAMSGSHIHEEKPRKAKKPKEEALQRGDYLEIAKTLSKKYFSILRVNLEYYSRVGAALGRQYGSLSMGYAGRFMRSLFHYSKIYGRLIFERGVKFTRYVYKKIGSVGGQLRAKLAKK